MNAFTKAYPVHVRHIDVREEELYSYLRGEVQCVLCACEPYSSDLILSKNLHKSHRHNKLVINHHRERSLKVFAPSLAAQFMDGMRVGAVLFFHPPREEEAAE